MNGMMVGWQSRFIGERYWPTCPIPKYYDMPRMPKRLMLYGYDEAAKHGFAVVCEGVTDVWRIGPPAVALLGKTPSVSQKRLLVTWRRGALVVLLDGDAADESQHVYHEACTSFAKGVVQVTLPPDLDPGDLERNVIWDLIHRAAREQGVDLGDLPPRD
jgi:hypothetical protein